MLPSLLLSYASGKPEEILEDFCFYGDKAKVLRTL